MSDSVMTVLVLGGGPDRERAVSLKGRAEVAAALRRAGHRTLERSVAPDDLAALDESFDVVFPVLHGPWGEGGPLQQIMEQRGLRFVGCGSAAARLGIDKLVTKRIARAAGLETPAFVCLDCDNTQSLQPPVVIKPIDEGSSFGVRICMDQPAVAQALDALRADHESLLVERYVRGRELTVGIVAGEALPPIEIVPRGGFYDYHAKYDSDETTYRFEFEPPAGGIEPMQVAARRLHEAIGARDLSRVDFVVDEDGRCWVLEINTMPGFTTHSLLPMAARQAGLAMTALCDRLVRLAAGRPARHGPSSRGRRCD
ncbi:MAG: D-alanine--D-alanine ligase [Alphaproteobacteria bacterium]|jgi:D-alanine-D-alanine ligase|nr:D-alanine--D-alanine ligase [Alphaproteobacteria bacterium]